MKSYRWKILLCVLPVLVSAVIVGRALMQYSEGTGGFKLGVDLAGGTILVYEVADPDVKVDMNELAEALKRRIDQQLGVLAEVTIRPVGEGRVEIILPTGGQHQSKADQERWNKFLTQVAEKWPTKEGKGYADVPRNQLNELTALIQKDHPKVKTEEIEEFFKEKNPVDPNRRKLTSEQVEQIKELIARQGSLEFRILANEHDEPAALEAARALFAEAKKNQALENDLKNLAEKGKPPPPPRNPQNGPMFTATDGSEYSYSWVALSDDERRSLGLGDDTDLNPRHSQNLARAASAREKNEPFSLQNGLLAYSRPFTVAQPLAKDRGKKVEYFILTRESSPDDAVTGKYLVDAGTRVEGIQPVVTFQFDSEGARRFRDLTVKNKPEGGVIRNLAIVLDDQVVSAPNLNQAIPGGSGQISGISSDSERQTLVRILKAGRLPATLKQRPVSENTIGATLGEDTIRSSAIAVLLSFVAVLVFMMVYYRFAGLVASAALLANLLLTVAFMIIVNATFTLPGLAGLVLMLGMAVDANVLIYERLREERDRGASLALAIRNGYDRAFPTIIDTHLTSIFTAIVLYVVGNDQLKGFGISLTVGLIISLFTSLYMTRTFFDLALARGWLTKLSMMRLLTRPNIDFMSIRQIMFSFTAIVSILGVVLFLFRGEQGLNIDFVGGTAYTAKLVELEGIQTLRDQLGKHGERLKIAPDGVKALGDNTFEVTYDDGNGNKDVRVIHVDESREKHGQPPTVEEVRQRASELPDLSLEMIFLNDPESTSGDKSKVFTVRTSEKATELVQMAVSRLLGERLERSTFNYEITGADAKLAKTVLLIFVDPSTGKKEFDASPARVAMLLKQEMAKDSTLKDAARQVLVAGDGEEKEGLFEQVKVVLPGQGVDRGKLETVLKELQKQYANSPQPLRLENFDSQLATETQNRALIAILLSWGAILVYLWFRFGNWTFGLAAVICLIHDLCFTLGIIAACHYVDLYIPGVAHGLGIQDFKLDLAAIASLLTLVGFSVNDTIVVFDRIREVRGKNPALTSQMINDSVNQTLSRTILTSFTTWLVVFVLYIFGGAGVHLFAFVMVVGVLIGTYSSIYVASPLLLLLGEGKVSAKRGQRQQPAAAGA